MWIRIDADDLPGRTCPPAGTGPAEGPRYTNVHVAVQGRRPTDLLDPVPGDAASASWTLACTAVPRPGTPSGIDLRGAHIQGRPGDRFVYLSWGTVDPAGTFTMFRRAKLMLAAVPDDALTRAATSGVLTAHLALTDTRGEPVCARIVPPGITWSYGS
ncbi:DUF5990 family protein [Embleya hyalina]|uniref:Monooxygenase n=1 Tax=Embleya hyalina TaxID=516124 RepID=A0A401YZU5_9ACTN|nr:DUF5990 family protein [Embleya hyalina]GCE00101.1 hypothetical protein EHYA_07826 [Embleya hyalina]